MAVCATPPGAIPEHQSGLASRPRPRTRQRWVVGSRVSLAATARHRGVSRSSRRCSGSGSVAATLTECTNRTGTPRYYHTRDLLRIPSCAFRPAALKLHRACAGPSQPRPSSRWSSCHSAPGAISSPQRTQVAYPLRTTSSTRGRTVLYTRPYRRNAPYAATQRDRPPGRDTERGQLPLLCLKRHGYRVCGVLYCLESPDADYLADVGSADEGRPVGGGFPRRRPGGRGWTPASV